MELSDRIILRGSMEMALKNAMTGEVISTRSVNNIVVTAGRRWILEALQSGAGATSQTIQQLAVGTGTTAPATSQTALVNEAARKAIASFTTSNLTSNPPSWRAEVSFATNEANTTLGEVGLVNSSSGGTMIARATFGTIDKTTSNTLSISYTLSN